MNKKLLKTVVFGLWLINAHIAIAQLRVSTTSGNKKAIIEEFTGIHCGWCPDGHKIASQLVQANPGNVYSINIHTAAFATPSGTELDFRTTEGTQIAGIPNMNVTGYPTGSVNRHVFPGDPDMAISRFNWGTSVSTILAQPASCGCPPVNTLQLLKYLKNSQRSNLYLNNQSIMPLHFWPMLFKFLLLLLP